MLAQVTFYDHEPVQSLKESQISIKLQPLDGTFKV